MPLRMTLPRGAVLAGVVFVLAAGLAAAIDTTKPAPTFHAKTLDGERFSKESLRGKVVLLQFWATWCRFCRRDQPAVDAIAREYEKQGLIVLAVNVGESKSAVKRFLKESPRECRVVASEDTNLPALFETRSFPFYVLIDREGRLAGAQRGAAGAEALRRLLSNAGLDSE